MKTIVKNAEFDDILVSQDANNHIRQSNDSQFFSYNPVDGPTTLVVIAGTSTGLDSGQTAVHNVTVPSRGYH